MEGFIISILTGLICIVLGIINMTGNISTLHSYHRHRVSEEDRIPFGKKVGLGTIIIGAGVTVFGGLLFATELMGKEFFAIIGTAVLIISIVVGLIITFKAMIKYNKGIF